MPCQVTDETYIKVRGKWTYLYRAVDRDGQTVDFMLSMRRDLAAARRFLRKSIKTNNVPGRIIGIVQSKYLNNIVEQDHRFIKKVTRPMLGFKGLHSAASTPAGIETAHMIQKGQLGQTGLIAFQQFAELGE